MTVVAPKSGFSLCMSRNRTPNMGELSFGVKKNLSLMFFQFKLWNNLRIFLSLSSLSVLQSLDQDARKDLTPLKLRAKAAKFAKQTVQKQMASFKVIPPSLSLTSLLVFWFTLSCESDCFAIGCLWSLRIILIDYWQYLVQLDGDPLLGKYLNFNSIIWCLQRFGVWADWNNPYLTLDPEYEAAQVAGSAFLILILCFFQLN